MLRSGTSSSPGGPGSPTGKPGERVALTVETHANCPGHAAYLTETWVRDDRPAPTAEANAASQDRPDGDSESDSDEVYDESDEPGEDSGDQEDLADEADEDPGQEPDGRWEWVPVFVCTDPIGNGHNALYGAIAKGKPTVAVMTDKQREAGRAERRDVIESNKAFDSATAVRTEFLRGLLARKTAPWTACANCRSRRPRAVTLLRTDTDSLARPHGERPPTGKHRQPCGKRVDALTCEPSS